MMEIVRQEPFVIAACPAGRVAGVRDPSSPLHGWVDIGILSGPGRGTYERMSWQEAIEFARALRDPTRAAALTTTTVRVLHVDGGLRVERVVPGGSYQHWFKIVPTPGADASASRKALGEYVATLARHIHQQARLAEQDQAAIALQVAQDHAELARAGFGLGLTRDPGILAEARKIHDHDRKLRRYVPISRLDASIALPMPGVKLGPANPLAAARERAKTMSAEERSELAKLAATIKEAP